MRREKTNRVSILVRRQSRNQSRHVACETRVEINNRMLCARTYNVILSRFRSLFIQYAEHRRIRTPSRELIATRNDKRDINTGSQTVKKLVTTRHSEINNMVLCVRAYDIILNRFCSLFTQCRMRSTAGYGPHRESSSRRYRHVVHPYQSQNNQETNRYSATRPTLESSHGFNRASYYSHIPNLPPPPPPPLSPPRPPPPPPAIQPQRRESGNVSTTHVRFNTVHVLFPFSVV